MRKLFLSLLFAGAASSVCLAQNDSTASEATTQDAIYNRPFINTGKFNTAVGGYLEGNTNYFVTDGIPEGFSMEMRRFNIFLYSTIAKRIRFLSELEFEHGTEEIALETALIDFEINPALVFRAGILLPPIGGFNLNHDSPKWEFVERPLVSTTIIPSTLSEIGFGFNGKFYPKNLVITYDAYLVNGLRDEVVFNTEGRTFLPSGKDPAMFGEDNNGSPTLTGKIGIRHRQIGELGLSYYGGIYNTFRLDGAIIDEKRRLNIYAVDFNTSIKKLAIVGEAAFTTIDVPDAASAAFGNRQWGAFVDFVYPIIKRPILKWEKSIVNLNLRLERVDYNIGEFSETREKKFDEVTAIAGGVSYRPSANTVIRANYRYHWIRDLLGNPTVRMAGIQVGVASYF